MEVVALLFDPYMMRSDQKCGQIRGITMVGGIKLCALFHIFSSMKQGFANWPM